MVASTIPSGHTTADPARETMPPYDAEASARIDNLVDCEEALLSGLRCMWRQAKRDARVERAALGLIEAMGLLRAERALLERGLGL